ncbi:F-box protein [Salix suchowensis]|nr:F-box protein [Salix suchowensis]
MDASSKMSLSHLSRDAVDLWNEWQIRSLMLLSLFLQIFLSIFGKRRKVSAERWYGPSLWIAYLSADWVATFSLGILARSESDSKNWNWIPVFWAPLLLVHLGGPGAITAYSVDRLNKLFLSRLLQLVTHVGVVCYVLFRLWSKDTITSVVISLLILGIIKYGERIWVLMRGHEDSDGSQQIDFNVRSCNHLDAIKSLHDGYLLFQALETLLKNLDLVANNQKFTYDLVSVKKAKEAFQLVEVELGFKYDRLYYKVTMISRVRVMLRSITFVSSIYALVSFSTKTNGVYSRNDRIISYVLLIGVVCLESYSIISHLLSDWGMIWLGRSKTVSAIVSRINYLSRLVSFSMKRKRWSRLMGQHNMIRAQSNKPVSKLLKKYFPGKWNVDKRRKVKKEIKELIFKQVLDKRSRYDPSTADFNCLQNILAERGDQVLRSNGLFYKFGWSVADLEFTQSLLTWHIATHVCYLDDSRNNTFEKTQNGVKSSRSLSNYMLYLLANCPAMIAIEPSEKRHADTRNHLLLLLRNARNEVVKPSIPLDALSFHKTEVNAFFVKLLENPSTMLKEIGMQENGLEKSALLDGCMLALSLQSWETAVNGWSNGKKWEMISQVWVEMLMYAATHCRWKEHVHALSQGGELLTHVCVLMAHLGLSKQCPPVLNREVEDREKRFHVFLDRNYICV